MNSIFSMSHKLELGVFFTFVITGCDSRERLFPLDILPENLTYRVLQEPVCDWYRVHVI